MLTLTETPGEHRLLGSSRQTAPIREAAFRQTLGFALALLSVQFLLGTAVNLFVTIPPNHPGANPPEYFGGVVVSVQWAILHGAVWGLVLVLASVGALVQAIRLGGGGRITLAALGFVGVLGAGFNGGSFLNYNQNFSPMLMAVGFALAMSAYIAPLYGTAAPATARA